MLAKTENVILLDSKMRDEVILLPHKKNILTKLKIWKSETERNLTNDLVCK